MRDAGPGWAPAACEAGLPPRPRTRPGPRRRTCVSEATSTLPDTRGCRPLRADARGRQACRGHGPGGRRAGSAARAHAEGSAPTGSLRWPRGGPRSSPPWPGSPAEPGGGAAQDPRPGTREESLGQQRGTLQSKTAGSGRGRTTSPAEGQGTHAQALRGNTGSLKQKQAPAWALGTGRGALATSVAQNRPSDETPAAQVTEPRRGGRRGASETRRAPAGRPRCRGLLRSSLRFLSFLWETVGDDRGWGHPETSL